MGRAEIELSEVELRAIERVGPYRRSRRLPVMRVSRLVVGHLPTSYDGKDYGNLFADMANEPGLAAILAEVAGVGPLVLAPGYPRAWLLALARDMARRGKGSARDGLFDLPPGKVEVVESAVEASGFLERPERPAGSDVVVERHPDGVRLIVPPRGVGRSAGGCLFLSVSLLFLAGALFCMLVAAGNVNHHGDPWVVSWMSLILGVLFLICAIVVGRRRTVLVVAGDTLRVTTAGPLGAQERRWRCEELVDIRTGRGDHEINDVPVPELQIHVMTGAKFVLLQGRDADELAFLATALRRSLHLPAKGE